MKDMGGGAKRIALMISMPSENAVRLPTTGGEATIVRTLKTLVSWRNPTNLGAFATDRGYATTDLLVVFYGQPGRMALYSKDSAPTTYNMFMSDIILTNAAPSYVQSVTLISDPLLAGATLSSSYPDTQLDYPVNIAYGVAASGGNFHGPYLPSGYQQAAESYLVFMNVGDELDLTLSTTLGAGGMSGARATVDVSCFDAPKQRPIEPDDLNTNSSSFHIDLPPAGGNATGAYYATRCGYYGFKITKVTIGTPAGGTWVSQLVLKATLYAGVNAGWANVCLPSLISTTVPGANGVGIPQLGYESRVNGASILLTNTTSALNRGGTVLASRLDSTVPFWSRQQADLVGASANAYTGDLGVGVYTYRESTDESTNYDRHCLTVGPVIPLDYSDRYAYFAMSVPSVGMPQNLAVQMHAVIEAKTTAETLGTPATCKGLHVEDLRAARALINGTPQWFFENPLHMSSILSWIKSAGRKLVNAAPKLLGAASVMAPQYAVPLGTLGTLLHQLRS